MKEQDRTKDPKLQVLKYKLQGWDPERIAKKLDIGLAEVIKHNSQIKRDMAKESQTNLDKIDPNTLEDMMEVASSLMPYMEKATDKIRKRNEGIQPLHIDMVENAELMMKIVRKSLIAMAEEKEIDLKRLAEAKDILKDLYQAFFNKNGIQVINMLNTGGTEGAAAKRNELLGALKDKEEAILAELED